MQNNTSRFLQKKRALSLLGGLFITASVFGQNLTVTGTVKDVTGEPVIGANVIQEGTSNGSITDIDGKFSLSIPKGSVLVISYIGYASQNVTVTGNQPLVITLKDDTELLDGKPPVIHVFSATLSISIFVPQNEAYDDTRRSCRNYYVLQGTQSNL